MEEISGMRFYLKQLNDLLRQFKQIYIKALLENTIFCSVLVNPDVENY